MRLFTFGCSITQFFYPTWADLLIWHFGDKMELSENWGKSGAGNQYIFTRIWEADSIYNFNKDDIVIVQWSAMFRDDRFILNHGWHVAGNLYHGQLKHEPLELNNYKYSSQYQWADPIHCVMRDCAMIASIKTMLKERGCKAIYFNFGDFYDTKSNKDSALNFKDSLTEKSVNSILNQYQNFIETDLPPIMEWNGYSNENIKDYMESRPLTLANVGDDLSEARPEMHPLPFEYALYLEEFILPLLGETSLNDNAVKLAEHYQEKLLTQRLPVLSKLGWVEQNTEKVGWSDD